MEVYLVGGAVRDKLLNRPVKERDWVVVGSTPEEMLSKGYQPVGKSFPVFLHPETHEEYALARTEHKVAKGYKGFSVQADKNVTLTQDLQRRDLTINAMAESKTGEIIDPYQGREDLKHKILRHVSPAFQEDPVRILRLARFAARLPDFQVHPATQTLMKTMVENGEVDALVPERVWQELSRALNEPAPQRFFQVLDACHALPILFPELAPDFPILIKTVSSLSTDLAGTQLWAAILHHLDPETIQNLCLKYRIPTKKTDLALLVSRYFTDFKRLNPHDAEQHLSLIEKLDALRRRERFQAFLTICEMLHKPHETQNAARLIKALDKVKSVDIAALVKSGIDTKDLALTIRKKRLDCLKKYFS